MKICQNHIQFPVYSPPFLTMLTPQLNIPDNQLVKKTTLLHIYKLGLTLHCGFIGFIMKCKHIKPSKHTFFFKEKKQKTLTEKQSL